MSTLNHDVLLTRLQPLLDAARTESAQRDRSRESPQELVSGLLRIGVGAMRVPVELGGLGLSLPQLADVVIRVAAADSNLAQIIRGHLGFIEYLRFRRPEPSAEHFLREAARGTFFGPAAAERAQSGDASGFSTRLDRGERGYLLNGVKYYTTGSLYADHLNVLARFDEGIVEVVVRRDAAGVTVVDDWDGFGQRVTASGTATFADVEISEDSLFVHSGDATNDYLPVFYQFIHSATQAGICRRLVEDLGELVAARIRSYPLASTSVPADDPQVLEVVGHLESNAFSARAVVLACAAAFEPISEAAPSERAEHLREAISASAASQVANSRFVAESSWRFFDAASASAVSAGLGLDRHWRNARTITSHNPSIYKASQLGRFVVQTAAQK